MKVLIIEDELELAESIYSVIRRRNCGHSNIIQQNELTIDLLSRLVSVNEKAVLLTKKEFDLLLFFISNRNRVVCKSALKSPFSVF